MEYQQALEGQLEQTIESISGVESAQVSLVVPQQSDFAVGPQQSTTASILVDLAPGTPLSGGQVQAIEHLAASATPGLTTSNVTVVDNSGDVLSAKTTTGQTGSSDSAETASYDNQLSGSIEDLLDRVVGVGNSAVQVHALLNFNQQSTTTKGLQVNARGPGGYRAHEQEHDERDLQGNGHATYGRARRGRDDDERFGDLHVNQLPSHERGRSGHRDRQSGARSGRKDFRRRAAQL